MPLAFLTFQLLAPNGYQRRQPSRPRKDMTQQHFRGVAHSRSRRTLRVAGAAQPASRLIVPQRNAAHIRLMVKWAGVDFRRLLRSRFAGLGNRVAATCSWLRGSGGSSVQSSSAVSDGCSPSSSLSVNSTSVSPICDHGPAMQAGRARCTKDASGRAYDTIVAIRGWRPEDWSSGPGRRRAAQGLCGRSTNGAR